MSLERSPASGNGHEPGTTGTGRQILKFGRTFLGAPSMLGSVIPSSRFLVRKALDQIDWSRARLVVEYGPGMGTFTEEILKRLGPDGRLLVFETHPDFVRHLEEAIQDPRLEVIHRSAEEVETVLADRGWGPADYVVSGVPFSLMPDGVRDSILRGTRSVLAPGGAFLVYQFSPSIRPHLKDVFTEVEWGFEPRNFLPAMVFRCIP
jgi:phospholipid N-methyltransferase